MSAPLNTQRQRYLVRVIKRADPSERTTFRELFPDQPSLDEHGWCDAFGALDDDSASVPGAVAWFSVELDTDQVAAFAADPDVTALELAPPLLRRPTPLGDNLASADAPMPFDPDEPGPPEGSRDAGPPAGVGGP